MSWPSDERRGAASPAASRDLALVGLVVAAGGLVLAAATVLDLGLVVAAALTGAGWALPSGSQWLAVAARVVGHAGDPGAGAGPPWTALMGHPLVYWTVTGVIGVAAVGVLVLVGLLVWRRWGPVPAGHASREEVREELSVAACRRAAVITRPGLSVPDRRAAAPGELGVPLPIGPGGPMWLPLQYPSGDIAPTRSGKSRRVLMAKCLAAPGALLCSTTKPDLLIHTGLERARRTVPGPVLVFDATGTVDWPALLRWSPIAGCADPEVAEKRAVTMVEAAAVRINAGGGINAGNDAVFRDRAYQVIANYLIAAAISKNPHYTVEDMLTWALTRSTEPAQVLEGSDIPGMEQRGQNLRAEAGVVPETSDAVWMVVRRVLEPFQDATLRAMCTPAHGREVDLRALIANNASLYLIAGRRANAGAVAVLTALAEEWIDTARALADDYPGHRLDPPATAVLDELANATPLPGLPDSISDTAGSGVLIHWAAQDKAQLERSFGREGAALLLDNTIALNIWGGLKDSATLEWVSTAGGWRERDRLQTHHEGFLSPARTSLGTESVPVYRAGQIRTIPRHHVLVLFGTLRPIRARTRDIKRHPRWPQIRSDLAAINSGQSGLDAAGYLTRQPIDPHPQHR